MENTIIEKAVALFKGKPNKITVNTNIKAREETFRMIALAEVTGLPLLLIGKPGISKTACARDYLKVRKGDDKSLFVLEVNEDSTPADLLGRPNLEKLVTQNKYEIDCPLIGKEFIFINEIDKANGGFRNSMMGVLNEKVVFKGEHELPLDYKCFIATCNQIPKEEAVDNPMWDRFVLKMSMVRLSVSQIMDYFKEGYRNANYSIEINIPDGKTLSETKGLTELNLTKLVTTCYEHGCSDRTIMHIPNIVRAVKHIWNCSMLNAYIKTCEILAGPVRSKKLAEIISKKEILNIMSKIDVIPGISDEKTMKAVIHEVNVLITNYVKEGRLNKAEVDEIEEALNNALVSKGFANTKTSGK